MARARSSSPTPGAEARHLAENQIADVPAIVAAMTRLRGFAHLQIDRPVIRRGKSGHFCDKALEGVSHHAIVPNANVMEATHELSVCRHWQQHQGTQSEPKNQNLRSIKQDINSRTLCRGRLRGQGLMKNHAGEERWLASA
jgi:hypothetical protein